MNSGSVLTHQLRWRAKHTPSFRNTASIFSRDASNQHIAGRRGAGGSSGVYAVSLFWRIPTAEARSLTFLTLVVANVALIFTNRPWTRTIAGSLGASNPALWWVTGGSAVLLALLIFVSSVRNAFRFAGRNLAATDCLFGLRSK